MPSKYLTLLAKPRNYRVIIICLILATLSIASLTLYNGIIAPEDTSPRPTALYADYENYPISNNLLDNTEIINLKHNGRKRNGFVRTTNNFRNYQHSPEHILQRSANVDNGISIPNYNNNGQLDETLKTYYDNKTTAFVQKSNQCLDYKAFEPDIDAVKIYPTLPFEANWIRFREYWNTFFESRYQNNKKSKDVPHLQVFVIPHSHNDPGWIKKFEEYFHQQTKHIIDNSIDKLMEHKAMTFQWSEISFLSKWWESAHPIRKQNLLRLIDERRFEIVTGGWVMTDEATVHIYSMIDQLVEGHQWVKNHLNVVPKSSWSVDPFGHGSTMPYILKSAGIKSMVIQRIHYAWKKWLAEQQFGDFLWIQRWDNSASAKTSIFCHNAPFDIYSIKHSCGPHPHICLNFDFRNISGEFSENHMYFQPVTVFNVKEKAELLLEQYGKTASLFPHNVAMISLGDDFRFDHAIEWDQQYLNYIQLFNYINSNFNKYKTEIKFGTISEYFQAVGERVDLLPTFSGDFFVYSDIFSEGRPAYWSGYYGTRPYWKKFYRETENALRSAEILFSFANVLALQKTQRINAQVLGHEYSNLIQARRKLALFAHHDATTGTSKVETMNDYGYKLMDAMQLSLNIQMVAVNSILFSQTNNTHLATDFEQLSFGDLPRKIPIKLNAKNHEKKIILFNNLGWKRNHTVKVIVTLPNMRVIGPHGRNIPSQLNPVMDVTNDKSSRISSQLFELTFVAELQQLSLTIFTIKQTTLDNEYCAVRSSVYCHNCSDPSSLFEVHRIQPGNIQLTSDRLQLLFDRNTGFLISIAKLKANLSIKSVLSFGSYDTSGHRSGAYLLMIDPREEVQTVPYPYKDPRIFIISGVISSEVTVFHSPLVLTTKILHVGGNDLEEAIFIQNQMDVGQQSGEVFLRFSTDLDSTTQVGTQYENGKGFTKFEKTPTFYTDQNGFSFEKRVKVSKIKLEGNHYPVTTMAYIEEEARNLRFSVLVDRSHGFSSMESGRLETLIERRTLYDDGRGMGEGVIDNRETISNYIITLESIKPKLVSTKNIYSVPTLAVHHLSQELNYPPSLFVMNFENFPRKTSSASIFTMLNNELPCDVHLINFRTMTESFHFDTDVMVPSKEVLMILQKFGYSCPKLTSMSNSNNNDTGTLTTSCASNSQSLLYPSTNFNRIHAKSITKCDLTGNIVPNNSFGKNNDNFSSMDEMTAAAFEMKSFIVKFN